MTSHPSSFLWYQFAADDLGAAQRVCLWWHVRRCDACARERQQILVERRAYRPPAEWASRPLRPTPRLRARPMAVAVAFAGAVAAGLLLMPTPPSTEALRAKGGDTFALFVRRGEESAPLGGVCHSGDMLRARYGTDLPYVLVVGLDGAGQAQVLLSEAGQRSARAAEAPALTPGSWILDGEAGVERFVALFSPEPLEAAAVVTALRAGQPVPGRGVRVREQRCHKVVP
jgi:hypothetical protein